MHGRLKWCVVMVAALGCSERSQIALEYDLTGLQLAEVVRVETYVAVDPSDARGFFADQPYRAVATGVGYEVRDFDGSGTRRVLVTHDAALGFEFTPMFVFTLLPPSGKAPPLVVNARALGASAMLGRTDPLKAAFASGARLAVKIGDMRCGGVFCASDEECCSDSCVNTATSTESCGACGQTCGARGDECAGGACHCAGGSECTGSKACCAHIGCIDLMTDAFNCGGCGKSCNPGETCAAGECRCNDGPACGAGGLCCAATGCSMTGSCPCGASACPAPKVCCNAAAGTCVDLRNDNAHCGTCTTTCVAPLACANGACACQGQICSAGDACCSTGCANLQTSTSSCGTCGHACQPNESCVAGACKCGTNPGCSAGQSCCNGACVDTQTDEMSCGGCGTQCNPGEQCLQGACVCPGTSPPRACTSTETCCSSAGSVGGGGCFDLTSSNQHCGSCTEACDANEECQSSNCVPTSCNPPCENGNSCDVAQNACKCNGGSACQPPNYCCASGCTNRLTDPGNCNACGNNVRPNLCCGGVPTPHTTSNCASCGDACACGQLCCAQNDGGYKCVDQDARNCGTCGKMCDGMPRDGGLSLAGICCPGCCCGDPGFCGAGTCPDLYCPLWCPGP